MKLLFLLMLPFAPMLQGQTTLTVTGPTTALPGTNITLTLTLAGSATQNVTALQWAHTLPTGFTLSSSTVSSSGLAIGKGVYCNVATCVLLGQSATNVETNNPMTDGAVATAVIAIPASAPPGITTLPLAGVFAASTAGFNVPIAAGAGYGLTILSKCDVNGDGHTDFNDVTLMINADVGKVACPLSSGTCNLQSAVAVLLASLGGACTL